VADSERVVEESEKDEKAGFEEVGEDAANDGAGAANDGTCAANDGAGVLSAADEVEDGAVDVDVENNSDSEAADADLLFCCLACLRLRIRRCRCFSRLADFAWKEDADVDVDVENNSDSEAADADLLFCCLACVADPVCLRKLWNLIMGLKSSTKLILIDFEILTFEDADEDVGRDVDVDVGRDVGGVVEEDVVIGEESCIENCICEGLLAAGSPEGSRKLGRVTGVTGVDEPILEQERRGTYFCSILDQSIVS